MNKKKLYWIFQIFGWSFYSVVNIVIANIVFADQNAGTISYIPLVAEAVFFLFATHFFRYFAKKLRWIELSMASISFRVVLGAIVIGFLIYLLRVGMSFLLGIYTSNLLSFVNIAGNTFPNTLVVLIWALFYFIFQYFERFNQSLKHEAEFHQIELNNLKSQLNPHFIFNSLNSIRALVDENPTKSKEAITQLSHILRNSLTTDQKRVERFEEEIKIVKDYLSLETIRYEERLQTEMDIHPDSYNYNVPPLMIQTLVENGIKHGVSKLKTGGKISVRTLIEKNKLIIQIRNTGSLNVNAANAGRKKGLGIANTKKRLKIIFGDEAHFSIESENANTVLTKLILPKAQLI